MIKKFSTSNHRYLYDSNTNNIVRLDVLTFDIVDDWGKLSNAAIVEKWSHKYDSDKVGKALSYIEEIAAKEGIFSTLGPKCLESSWGKRKIKESLDTQIEQLILSVSEDCNLRCSYCVYSGQYKFQRVHRAKYMDFSLAKEAIDFFLAHSKGSKQIALGFYGGEPLLNFELIKKCIDYFEKETNGRETHITLTTNGTLLKGEIARYLLANHVQIVVSLDGPEEIHNRYRKYKNGRGTFKTVWDNITRLRDEFPEDYHRCLSYNVLIAPPYELLKVNDFFLKNRALLGSRLQPSYVDPYDTNFFSIFEQRDFAQDDYELMKHRFIRSCIEGTYEDNQFLKRFFERRIMTIYKRKLYDKFCETHFPNGICLPGTRRLFVGVDGMLRPCERVNDHLVIGDIKNGFDYGKVHDLISDYSRVSTQDCCYCWALRLCSACFVQAFRNGIDPGRKHLFCRQEKFNLEHDLSVYCSILEENPSALDYMKKITIT